MRERPIIALNRSGGARPRIRVDHRCAFPAPRTTSYHLAQVRSRVGESPLTLFISLPPSAWSERCLDKYGFAASLQFRFLPFLPSGFPLTAASSVPAAAFRRPLRIFFALSRVLCALSGHARKNGWFRISPSPSFIPEPLNENGESAHKKDPQPGPPPLQARQGSPRSALPFTIAPVLRLRRRNETSPNATPPHPSATLTSLDPFHI